MRWLGALLLVSACGGIGLAKTGNLRRRIALLESLCEKLRQLQTELLQRNPPLPEILKQLEQPALAENVRRGMTMGQAAKPLLQRLEGELPKTAQTLSSFAAVWGDMTAAHRRKPVPMRCSSCRSSGMLCPGSLPKKEICTGRCRWPLG